MLNSPENKYDPWLLGAVIILVMLGLFMIYSASSFRAEEKYGDETIFLKQHVFRVLLSFAALFLAARIDYHRFKVIMPFVFLGLLVLLLMVFFGSKINGSRRAMSFLGKSFQPSEFMKLCMIFYLAAVLGQKWDKKNSNRERFITHYVILLGVVGCIFLEPDLGTSMVVFFVGFTMFYLAGTPWGLLAKMGASMLPLILLGITIFPYQKRRLMDFIHSALTDTDMSYQVKQSIIGLAQGGVFGMGYGVGKQKMLFLPEPFSDFILSSLGEEFGFVGILFVFVLLSVILWRGLSIARSAPDRYGYLIAGGITSLIMINALINASVAVNLLPTTGLPFPFLSYGGSSLLVLMGGVGVLLNISKKRPVSYRKFTRQRATLPRWQVGRM
ncbi:cell division protein FtsW [bacterium]|nr:cell division protein FtsW [bacterium]